MLGGGINILEYKECPECGTTLTEEVRICEKCGFDIENFLNESKMFEHLKIGKRYNKNQYGGFY